MSTVHGKRNRRKAEVPRISLANARGGCGGPNVTPRIPGIGDRGSSKTEGKELAEGIYILPVNMWTTLVDSLFMPSDIGLLSLSKSAYRVSSPQRFW